jgi:hypothetical protein
MINHGEKAREMKLFPFKEEKIIFMKGHPGM